MKYRLFLDESGKFSRKQQKSRPSIVAGYLVQGDWDEDSAYKLRASVRDSSPEFRGMSLGNHAMEAQAAEEFARNTRFGLTVIRKLTQRGHRVVRFQNEKGLFFANADMTYLTVFTEGLMQLAEALLMETQETVELEVLYAHRIFTQTQEVKEQYIRMPAGLYESQIEARMMLLKSRLAEGSRLKITLATDSATRNQMLVLADSVCFTLLGGRKHLSAKEEAQLTSLPLLSFGVLGQALWPRIAEALMAGRLAEAVTLWYRNEPEELEPRRAEFEAALLSQLQSAGEGGVRLELKQVAQLIDSLVSSRELGTARRLIERLQAELLPLLGEGQEAREFAFDLDFFLLTVSTHEGRLAESALIISRCDGALAGLRPTCETLDYYIRYEIRKLEACKNAFDFEGAVTASEELERTLRDMEELFGAIHPLKFISEALHSTNLGSALGSRVQARAQLIRLVPEEAELAREEAQRALGQFAAERDRSRAYQSLAQVEYLSGSFDAALAALAQAFGLAADAEAADILRRLLAASHPEFGLMHYTSIMGLAALEGHPLGHVLLSAWIREGAERQLGALGREYPMTTVYWRSATAFAAARYEHAAILYKKALEEMLRDPQCLPVYAAGMAALAEAISFVRRPYCLELLEIFAARGSEFLAAPLPASMGRFFEGWDELLRLARESLELGEKPEKPQRKLFLQKSRQIPVL